MERHFSLGSDANHSISRLSANCRLSLKFLR